MGVMCSGFLAFARNDEWEGKVSLWFAGSPSPLPKGDISGFFADAQNDGYNE